MMSDASEPDWVKITNAARAALSPILRRIADLPAFNDAAAKQYGSAYYEVYDEYAQQYAVWRDELHENLADYYHAEAKKSSPDAPEDALPIEQNVNLDLASIERRVCQDMNMSAGSVAARNLEIVKSRVALIEKGALSQLDQLLGRDARAPGNKPSRET